MSATDETRADTSIITAAEGLDATLTFPAIPADLAAPRPPAITCGGCGETFAQAAFGGRALFLAETLRAAAVTAGWTGESEGTWTCTVCLAKAGAAPAPTSAPAASPPPPDTDPYKQYQDVQAEIDAGESKFWGDVNPSNAAAGERAGDRIGDGYHNVAHLLAEIYCAGNPEKAEQIRLGMWDMSAKYRRSDARPGVAA